MRIFIAGASGAVGQPLVRRLAAAGHEVTGMTRTPEKAARAARARRGCPSSPTRSTARP